jgi:hypothetical protein
MMSELVSECGGEGFVALARLGRCAFRLLAGPRRAELQIVADYRFLVWTIEYRPHSRKSDPAHKIV